MSSLPVANAISLYTEMFNVALEAGNPTEDIGACLSAVVLGQDDVEFAAMMAAANNAAEKQAVAARKAWGGDIMVYAYGYLRLA